MASRKKTTASTSAARRTEREAAQDPGVEFDDALGELQLQTTRITAAQKGKGVAAESSPAPAPEQDDGMNLDEDDTNQRGETPTKHGDQRRRQRRTKRYSPKTVSQHVTPVMSGVSLSRVNTISNDPVEADGAEHGESSPAKEAASRQVKFTYKSQRLIDQEEKRAEALRKKLEKDLAERMRICDEELARTRERGEEHLREIDREFNDPPRAAASTSNHRPAPKTRAVIRGGSKISDHAQTSEHVDTRRTTPGAKRTKKTPVPTITPLAAEGGMVAEAGSVAM
ncbi:hypothetical protein B0H14DRAFT_3469078 [Mycena olivaceomarginata]|nr:hypothetical protein B0H14DRAFT_3469078 [Mycena olivaceomarginata]